MNGYAFASGELTKADVRQILRAAGYDPRIYRYNTLPGHGGWTAFAGPKMKLERLREAARRLHIEVEIEQAGHAHPDLRYMYDLCGESLLELDVRDVIVHAGYDPWDFGYAELPGGRGWNVVGAVRMERFSLRAAAKRLGMTIRIEHETSSLTA